MIKKEYIPNFYCENYGCMNIASYKYTINDKETWFICMKEKCQSELLEKVNK